MVGDHSQLLICTTLRFRDEGSASMSIRARIEDATILYTIGRPQAALLCVLTAVAATSRRRRPNTTRSDRDPPKKMGDGEAFEAFLSDEMPRICNVVNYCIEFRGQTHRIEHVWYKWLRCELAHEASLPTDIDFVSDSTPGVTRARLLSLTAGSTSW
jgi:hypothetical protein